jgi:hypothetical protein
MLWPELYGPTRRRRHEDAVAIWIERRRKSNAIFPHAAVVTLCDYKLGHISDLRALSD